MAIRFKNEHLPFLIGVLLILIVMFFVFFIGDINQLEYEVLKIILALGASGFATQITGLLDIKIHSGIKATGALGVFVIIYLLSPSTPEGKNKNNNTKYTNKMVVTIEDRQEKLQGKGIVSLVFHDNSCFCSSIDERGVAVFKTIPSEYSNDEYKVSINIPGYELYSPSNHNLKDTLLLVVDTIQQPLPKPETDLQIIRFAVLLSGDLQYTRDIFNGFRKELTKNISNKGYEPFIYEQYGTANTSSDAKANMSNYYHKIDKFFDNREFDYYVTIGSQASIAFDKYIKEKELDIPFLFLGVTEPDEDGINLVTTLTKRSDRTNNVAGVAYCEPIINIPIKLHELLPNSKLIFIYDKGYPQDKVFADKIKKLDYVEVKELDRLPVISDFSDDAAIYFSWYTFEKMFENKEQRKILQEKNIVASTLINVKTNNLAPIGISADDIEIGKLGANLFIDTLFGNEEKWWSIDIYQPDLYLYINCTTLKQKKIKSLNKELNYIKQKFNCE